VKKNGTYERRRPETKQKALDRMRTSTNISKLSKDLGIPRRTLYAWLEAELAKEQKGQAQPQNREQALEREIARLKEALADRSLDLDFFKAALQRIWERRPPRATTDGSASTKKSGQ
jgi:septal ring factor EnvC (AmiA/AmiB activator)